MFLFGNRRTINGVFRATNHADPVAEALEKRGAEALAAMPERLLKPPQMEVALRGYNIVGIDALRGLLSESAPLPATAGNEELGKAVAQLPGLSSVMRYDHHRESLGLNAVNFLRYTAKID